MDKVANSTDIAELVKQFGQNQAALAGMVKSSLDSLKTFASIKIDKKVTDSLKKMKNVKSTFNTYSSAVSEMIDSVSNLLPKNASPEKLNATLAVLSGDPKKTLEIFSDSGKKISTETTDEKKGVLDIIGTTLGLIKQIAEVQPPNRRKLNKTIQSYSDTVTMLWSFVKSFGESADPAAALESAKASKTITDAMLNLTGIFAGIQKDLLPMSELVVAFEPSLERGMKLLYDPTADTTKQFSIISTVIGAAEEAKKLNPENVKLIGILGDSVNKSAKSMIAGLGLLGIKKVSETVKAGTTTLKDIIYDVIECSNLAAAIDPADMKNLNASVSVIEKTVEVLGTLYIKVIKAALVSSLFSSVFSPESGGGEKKAYGPFAWLGEAISSIEIPPPQADAEKNAEANAHIVELMTQSAQNLIGVSGRIVLAVPKILIASSVLGWLYEKVSEDMSVTVNSVAADNISKFAVMSKDMAVAAESLMMFVSAMPKRRKLKNAMESLLVIGEVLGGDEVQDQFLDAMAAIELMADNKDKFAQFTEVLDSIKDTMKAAAVTGMWCLLGIPGLWMLSFAGKALKEAVSGLMSAIDGIDKQRIEDAGQQFHDIGMMVVWAGATVAVCALVGALTILALPAILVGFAAIAAVVLTFIGVMLLIELVTRGKQIQSHAEAIADLGRLILLAGAVIAISVLVGLLVIKAFKLILVGFAALMVVTIALIGVLWLIGKVGEIPGLKTGMLMLIAMIISMMLAALMITIVSKVGAGIDIVGILKFTLTLAIITAAYLGLGLLMAAGGIVAVVLATAGIILISVSMLLITGAIAAVNKTLSKTDQEQTKENISAMLDSMKYVVDYVNENFTVKDMAAAAAKMFLMANMSKHLMRMALRIQKIASLDMEEFDDAGHPTGKRVKMKTQDFIDAAVNGIAVAQTIAAMFDSEPTKITTSSGTFTVTGLSDQVLERITNKNKRKIRQLSKITKFVAKMATTVANIASLKMETEWGPDGKAIKFQKMTLQDFTDASLNGIAVVHMISSLLNSGTTVIETSVGTVKVSGIPDEVFEKIDTKAKRKFRQLSKITAFIGRMTETVTKIASLKIPTAWNAEGKPTSFEAISAEEMKDAALNAAGIAQFFAAVAANNPSTITMGGGVEIAVTPTSENLFEKVERQTKKKFKWLGKIVTVIAGMTKTVADTASLRIPTAWNDEGTPIKYEAITATQMQDAAENVVTIMNTLLDAITGEKITNALNSFDGKHKKAFKRIFSAIEPITGMVDTVVMLAGGSIEEYDEEGHPTGKQVSLIKALEAKPAIIDGIVALYGIFADAIAVITGQETMVQKQEPKSTGQKLAGFVKKAVEAAAAPVLLGAKMVESINSRIDTGTAVANIKSIIDPITSLVDAAKKVSETMAEINIDSVADLNLVASNMAVMVNELGTTDYSLAKDNIKNMIEPIDGMLRAIKKISETMASVYLEAGEKLRKVMASSVGAVSGIAEQEFTTLRDRMETLWEYAGVIKKFTMANQSAQAADNIDRTMKATEKFVVQLNKVSDTKLSKMASISKNMADFARKINGNFDRLADAMNEKMVTALDKVDKTLKEVNKTMNEMPGKMKSAVSNIQVTGGGGDDKPKVTGSESVTDKSKQQTGKGSKGKNVTGKSVSNCIVQADDGTFALAVVQKYE